MTKTTPEWFRGGFFVPVPCSYEYPTKSGKALRAEFLPGKTEDAGRLTPAKDDNAA